MMTDHKPSSGKTDTQDRSQSDSDLDAALRMTFPASDPVSLTVAKADAARMDRRPPAFARDLVAQLARRARGKQRGLSD